MTTILGTDQVVQLVAKTENLPDELLGYGIESDSTEEERRRGAQSRLQRWHLFRTSFEQFFPTRKVIISRVPATSPWSIGSGHAFREYSRTQFVRSRDMYVVANCLAITGSEKIIPNGYATLPEVSYFPPASLTAQGQGDFKIGKIFHEVRGTVGYFHAVREATLRSREFWVLNEGYSVPGYDEDLGIAPFNVDGETFANLVDGTTWRSTSTFVIAACAYFIDGPPAAG